MWAGRGAQPRANLTEYLQGELPRFCFSPTDALVRPSCSLGWAHSRHANAAMMSATSKCQWRTITAEIQEVGSQVHQGLAATTLRRAGGRSLRHVREQHAQDRIVGGRSHIRVVIGGDLLFSSRTSSSSNVRSNVSHVIRRVSDSHSPLNSSGGSRVTVTSRLGVASWGSDSEIVTTA